MIDISNIKTYGWEAAIRGMRNPMNSWEKSDSIDAYTRYAKMLRSPKTFDEDNVKYTEWLKSVIYVEDDSFCIGPADQKLMRKLCMAGPEHRKFMRMIFVTMDIKAPLYWWKEYDTYKVGTVADSCSTMHKIAEKEFSINDFSIEHLHGRSTDVLSATLLALNDYRQVYLKTKDKDIWWQIIQLLPLSYNQLRTVSMNYEVLHSMYHQRQNHKLKEWRDFCETLKGLPFSELIVGVDEWRLNIPTETKVSSEVVATITPKINLNVDISDDTQSNINEDLAHHLASIFQPRC